MKLKQNTGFFIKRPDKNRKSFSINVYEKEDGKRVNNRTGKFDEIDSINNEFLSELLTYEQAERLVVNFKDSLVDKVKDIKPKYYHNQENVSLVEKYIKHKYRIKRKRKGRVREDSINNMETSCLRAISCLEGKSILTASESYIQRKLDEYFEGGVHKTMTSRLRQILKYLERDMELVADIPDSTGEVKHLKMNDCELLLAELWEIDKVVYWCAFLTIHSGMRIGEVMYSSSESYINAKQIAVKKQMRTDWTIGPTKNKKARQAYTNIDLLTALDEWEQVDELIKIKYRKSEKKIPDTIKKVCKKLWPRRTKNHLTHHDLRHSYAVNLLQNGVPIDLVAQVIGDTVEVCKKNYTGSIINDVGISSIANIMNK